MFIRILIELFLTVHLTASALSVPTTEWKNNLERVLPHALCSSENYYGQCFVLKESACIQQVKDLMPSCWSGIKVSKNINPETDGMLAASKWGACIGRKFEHAQLNQKRNDKKCDQTTGWL